MTDTDRLSDAMAERAEALGLVLVETVGYDDDGLPTGPPRWRLRVVRPEWDDLPDLAAVDRVLTALEDAMQRERR